MGLGTLLGAALLSTGAPTTAPRHYVPAGVERYVFYERWFGGQLRAMREPILAGPGTLGRFHRRFRLLVLPTFDHGYAIRVDEDEDGADLHFVRLSGRGGYAPGHVATRGQRRLDRETAARVDRAVDQSGVANLPWLAPPPQPATLPSGEQEIQVCGDGTDFVFETVDAGGSHFVTRSCGISPELLALARQIEAVASPLSGARAAGAERAR